MEGCQHVVSSRAASAEGGWFPVREKWRGFVLQEGEWTYQYQCSQLNYRACWQSIIVTGIVLTSNLKWKEAQKGRGKERIHATIPVMGP